MYFQVYYSPRIKNMFYCKISSFIYKHIHLFNPSPLKMCFLLHIFLSHKKFSQVLSLRYSIKRFIWVKSNASFSYMYMCFTCEQHLALEIKNLLLLLINFFFIIINKSEPIMYLGLVFEIQVSLHRVSWNRVF